MRAYVRVFTAMDRRMGLKLLTIGLRIVFQWLLMITLLLLLLLLFLTCSLP